MPDFRRAIARLTLLLVSVAVFVLAQYGCLAATLSIVHAPQGQGDISPTSLVLSGNVLYGTTHEEMIGPTSVFRVNLDGTGYATIHTFESTSTQINYTTGQLVIAGNTIYGVTSAGGSYQGGTIYSVNTDGTNYQILHSFGASSSDADGPQAGLTLDGSVLYGTTYQGGTAGQGAIFKLNLDGSGYGVLHSLAGNDGQSPFESLTVSNGKLFGTTPYGGTGGSGTVFSVAEDGTGFTVVHSLSTADGDSASCVPVISGNTLYGTATGNGSSGGFIYSVALDGSGYHVLYTFPLTGTVHPQPGKQLVVLNGTLYGTSSPSNATTYGTVYKINPDGTNFTTLYDFSKINGDYPTGPLITNGVKLYGLAAKISEPSTEYGSIFSINVNGLGYAKVHDFSGGDGVYAGSEPVLSNGVLYGTSAGGPYGTSAIYKVNSDGTGYTILHAFTPRDGSNPEDGLLLSGNVLYGSTYGGAGDSQDGVVYKVNTDGTGFTVLHQFAGTDGTQPEGNLVLGGNTLYGVTAQGGASGFGAIFKVNTDGTNFADLYSFASQNLANSVDGLTLSGNTLFGTMAYFTVYKINTDGTGFATILGVSQISGYFNSRVTVDGASLYGVTSKNIFKANLDGTGYQVLHTFQQSDGQSNFSALARVGTTLYGTAQYGGDANNDGTLFSIQEDGTNFQVLYEFNQLNIQSSGGTVATDGTNFYGGAGALYRLSLLSGPVLSAQDTAIDGFDDPSVLWTGSDDSMRVWDLYSDGTFAGAGPTYGPYSDAGGTWHAKSVKTIYDGPSHVLWTRDDGAIGLWSLDQSGNETQIGSVYGPYSDANGTWSAVGFGVAADSTSRVLWKRSDGAVGIWTFGSNDTAETIGSVYGPYPGWTAQGFAVSADGSSRVLWDRSDGAAGLWTFSANDAAEIIGSVYGPVSDPHGNWSAASVGVAGDGTARLLWKRADGAAGLWTLDASDTKTAVGAVYGPYLDTGGTWAANALGVSLDGTSSVLWDRSDRAAGIWSFGANDLESVIGPVYGPL